MQTQKIILILLCLFANVYIANTYTYPNITEINPDVKAFIDGCPGDRWMFLKYNYPAMYIGDVLGFPAVYGFEPCNHCPCDIIGIGKNDAGVNSMELVQAYTQATFVAIAELANSDEVGIKDVNPLFDFAISPNPADGKINIQTNSTEPYKLIVYTTDGELDLSFLSKGASMINISIGKINISKHIVIK
jgi:hypothetical protein